MNQLSIAHHRLDKTWIHTELYQLSAGSVNISK